MVTGRGIRRLCRIWAIFLAFYSVKNADAHVNMLLTLYFPILLISFELIDKPPAAMTSVSWNDIFAVFKSIFGARGISVQVQAGGYFPLL